MRKELWNFLQDLRKDIQTKRVVILDNAPYNRATYTTSYVGLYGIELFFLLPYSPNLNLIERLWKSSKKKLVTNKIL